MNHAPTAVFRTDASVDIGIGHVMRCLTLADALRAQGARCSFVCRLVPGHQIDTITARGFPVTALPAVAPTPGTDGGLAHATWLAGDWQDDAQRMVAALGGSVIDLLVVDHYALDARWEAALRPHTRLLLAIDDLADRHHAADLLLDQNLGRQAADYTPWLGPAATLLTGPRYALLRPEFQAWRDRSLARRATAPVRRLLVTMGGIDQHNLTSGVLRALAACNLPAALAVDVVLGSAAPWLDDVRQCCARAPWPGRLHIDHRDMAALMAACDLAIGAAGATSWERCCLGLPTLMVAIAANQHPIAQALAHAGAGCNLQADAARDSAQLGAALQAMTAADQLQRASRAASALVDGLGTMRVCDALLTRMEAA